MVFVDFVQNIHFVLFLCVLDVIVLDNRGKGSTGERERYYTDDHNQNAKDFLNICISTYITISYSSDGSDCEVNGSQIQTFLLFITLERCHPSVFYIVLKLNCNGPKTSHHVTDQNECAEEQENSFEPD